MLKEKKKFPQKLLSQIIVLIVLAVVCNIIDMAVAFSSDKTSYFAVVIDIICIIYLCFSAYMIYKNTCKEMPQLHLMIFILYTGIVFLISFILALNGHLLSYVLALIYGGLCAGLVVIVFVYPKNLAKLEAQKNNENKSANKPQNIEVKKENPTDSKVEIQSVKKVQTQAEVKKEEKPSITQIKEEPKEVKAQIKTETDTQDLLEIDIDEKE